MESIECPIIFEQYDKDEIITKEVTRMSETKVAVKRMVKSIEWRCPTCDTSGTVSGTKPDGTPNERMIMDMALQHDPEVDKMCSDDILWKYV